MESSHSIEYFFNVTAIKLRNCPSQIHKACHFEKVPEILDKCSSSLLIVKSEIRKCIGLSDCKSCKCWRKKVRL